MLGLAEELLSVGGVADRAGGHDMHVGGLDLVGAAEPGEHRSVSSRVASPRRSSRPDEARPAPMRTVSYSSSVSFHQVPGP